jgi:2'-5' RNA ligase
VIRLFAAIAIPPEIGEGLVPGAKWRPTDAFHITLRFAGEISESVADDLDAELAAISGETLTLTLDGVGSFQDGDDVHAVWAGVGENAALRRLAARCESAARRAGLAPDKRTWRAHVTLAYLRRADPRRVAAWIQGHNLLKSPPFRVTRFGLYSSHLGDARATYRLERAYPLGLTPSPRNPSESPAG